jgi:hypothetical protein
MATKTHDGLRKENARFRKALEEIIRHLETGDDCLQCARRDGGEHAPFCPVTTARKALEAGR